MDEETLLYVDWESMPLITGTGGEKKVKDIKIDKSYFKTSSPEEEKSLADFKSFTESLYSLHKRRRRESDVERDVEEWFEETIRNYTPLSEKFPSEESERIVVKKKRRW